MTENKGSEASGDDGAPEQNKTEQKRIAVTIGIGFLFAPISVATTATLSKQPNNAAASLFVMARNIGGSVGISVVTSLVTSRSQVHMAYLSTHLTALDPGFGFSLAADGRARRPRGGRATQLYRAGLGRYIDVLDADRTASTADDQIALVRQAQTTGLVAVHKALGSGWQASR